MQKIDKDFLDAIDNDIELARSEISKHLSKFEDLDSFFDEAKDIIEYYFNTQNTFKLIWDFREYLKEQIKYYVYSFSLDRKSKDMDRLEYITDKYIKLIYFWEEKLDELEKNQLEESTTWVIKKSINKIFG